MNSTDLQLNETEKTVDRTCEQIVQQFRDIVSGSFVDGQKHFAVNDALFEEAQLKTKVEEFVASVQKLHTIECSLDLLLLAGDQ